MVIITKKIIFPILLGFTLIVVFIGGVIQFSMNKPDSISPSLVERVLIPVGGLWHGSSFSTTHNFILSIPSNEANGLNVTNVFFITSIAEEDLIELFASLDINITINKQVFHIMIVNPGSFKSLNANGWDTEEINYESIKYWHSYRDWKSMFLNSKDYTIGLKLFGVTTNPLLCKYGKFFCDKVEFKFEIGFELN